MKKSIFLGMLLATQLACADAPNYVSLGAGAADAVFSANLTLGHLWGDFSDNARHFNYGIEAGAFFYPNNTADFNFFGDHTNIKERSIDFNMLGVLKYTFANGLGFMAKAGPRYLYSQVSVHDNYLGDSASSGGIWAPEADLGINYALTQHTELGLQAGAYYVRGGYVQPMASLNFSYYFG